MIARAWCDPDCMTRLLEDVNAAADEMSIDSGVIPIRAIENTPEIHNVIVCTLCSCYPKHLIGLPPDWYKSRAYRSRVIREPRAVLKEFGTEIPDGVEVRVHDSTAELRYMVLPMRPKGNGYKGDEALASLVTRDCIVGVTGIGRAWREKQTRQPNLPMGRPVPARRSTERGRTAGPRHGAQLRPGQADAPHPGSQPQRILRS